MKPAHVRLILFWFALRNVSSAARVSLSTVCFDVVDAECTDYRAQERFAAAVSGWRETCVNIAPTN